MESETSNKAARRGKLVLRRIGSVVVGFVAIVVLSVATDEVLHRTGVMPRTALFDTGLLILALAYRSLFSVIGCYLTGRLAPDRPVGHALALGVVGVVVSAAGTVAGRDLGPIWYGASLAVVSLPLSWLGGRLSLLHRPAPAR